MCYNSIDVTIPRVYFLKEVLKLKRETINLETIHRFDEELGQEENLGCRLFGENVPEVCIEAYRDCFFSDLKKYFTNEDDLSRRIRMFEELTKYEFVVLDNYIGKDICNFKSLETADVFVIKFDLREKESPRPENKTLLERIIGYFI